MEGELAYPGHLWIVGKDAYRLIKKWEGFRATAYNDIGGNATIGWGHRTAATAPHKVTKAQADRLLQHDALRALECLRASVRVRLFQCEVDALVSLVFNIGCRAFKDSHLLGTINRKDMTMAQHEWLRWDHVNGKEVDGLKARRLDEWSLFARIPF